MILSNEVNVQMILSNDVNVVIIAKKFPWYYQINLTKILFLNSSYDDIKWN